MHDLDLFKIDTKQNIDTICLKVLNQALHSINAHSGSLMLVDEERSILEIKARLGEPKPRTTDPIFAIGDSSIAGHVAEIQKPYLCHNVRKDNKFAYPRSGSLNFKSLLSVPIIYGNKVIGIINADDPSEDYFTNSDLKILLDIARYFSEPIAVRIQRKNKLDSLYQVGAELTKLPIKGGIEAVLEKITQAAVESLNIDLVILYQYDQEHDLFLVEGSGPTIAGSLNRKEFMRTKVFKGDVPWSIIKEKKSGYYYNVIDHDFLIGEIQRPGQKKRQRFVEREGIKSMAALLLPNRAANDPKEEVVGVMFANYRSFHDFTDDEKKILATFADFAAVAIYNIRSEEKRISEQISFVESITASFAHRMSNMAGTIPVTVQQIRERIEPKEKYIHKQLDSIENDVKFLLALSKRISKPFKEKDLYSSVVAVDVNSLLLETVNHAQDRTRQVKVIKYTYPDLPKVLSSESQLREIFDNIIMNAIEAMENEPDPEIVLRTTFNNEKQRIEIEISNNGPAISSDIIGKLFSLGETTKREKALGIGLWASQTFMRAIGGDVLLARQNPPTFKIIIPRLYRRNIVSLEQDTTKLQCDILVVEDIAKWRDKVREIVEEMKYSVQYVSNYTEAKDVLKLYNFRLVILDIRLVDSDSNNIDGLELIDIIEKSNLITNFIILTGYGTDKNLRIARKSKRFIDFIAKDNINLSHFKSAIERGLRNLSTS